jgi:hypothetical protein
MNWVKKAKKSSTTTAVAPQAAFNPARFSSGLTENYYPKGIGPGVRLGIEKSKRVDWLRKKYGDSQTSVSLAARLEACKTDQRCRSPACPKCADAAQAFTTEVVGKFLAAHPDRKRIVCISVVPADGEIPKGKLSADQHARNVRRWKEALGRAGVPWFIGATDLSFNEHAGGRYPSTWQEHFYGLTATDDPVQLKKKPKKLFPASDAIPRPVKITTWDGNQTAVAYTFKPVFWRRIGTDDGQRRGNDGDGKRECRATDKQPLRSSQKRELLLHLDEIGIQGRLMMRWLQIIHAGGLGWSVVDRAPKRRGRGNG